MLGLIAMLPLLQVGALQFDNADWSDTPVMAEVQRIVASIDIPALFTGELALTPLRFRIGNDSFDLKIQIKTREQPMTTEFSAEIRNVDLRQVLAAVEVGNESAGTIAGRAKLWMTEDSIAALLGGDKNIPIDCAYADL